MKVHKIIFFVGAALIVNSFLGIPSDFKVFINLALSVFLVGLGVFIKLQILKKENVDGEANEDIKTFVESSEPEIVEEPEQVFEDARDEAEEVAGLDDEELVEKIDEQEESLIEDDNDESKETQ